MAGTDELLSGQVIIEFLFTLVKPKASVDLTRPYLDIIQLESCGSELLAEFF